MNPVRLSSADMATDETENNHFAEPSRSGQHSEPSAGATLAPAMRDRVTRTLYDRLERAREVNRGLDEAHERIRQQTDYEAGQVRANLREVEEAREIAEGAAIEALSRVGAKWNPQQPTDEAAVLRLRRADDSEVAAGLGIPWPVSALDARLIAWISWALVVPAGAMLGLSAGVLAHFLESDGLTRDLATLFLCLCIGTAAAIGLKLAVQHMAGMATELYYLGHRAKVAWAILTIAFICAALLIEIAVQRSGVLALQELLPGAFQRTSDTGYRLALWCLPVVLNAGFLLTAGFCGYYTWRVKPIVNQVRKRGAEVYEEAMERRRSNPAVQIALQALADLDRIRACECSELAKLREIERRCETSVAEVKSGRVLLPPAPALPAAESSP